MRLGYLWISFFCFASLNVVAQQFGEIQPYPDKFSIGVDNQRFVYVEKKISSNIFSFSHSFFNQYISRQNYRLGYKKQFLFQTPENINLQLNFYLTGDYKKYLRTEVSGKLEYLKNKFRVVNSSQLKYRDKLYYSNDFLVMYEVENGIFIFTEYGNPIEFIDLSNSLSFGTFITDNKLKAKLSIELPVSGTILKKYSRLGFSLFYNFQ